jgi:trehalose 6-phosphate phosphatase
MQDEITAEQDASPEMVPVPAALIPHLNESAILLDIDGTLLDLAPTPREVWVPPGLCKTLNRLLERTSGAVALVSGRSLNDIDLIFAPEQFPAIGGHGAEMRLESDTEAVATHAPPMDKELKRRLAALARLSPGILLEDKGYSLALHYRLAPHAEKAIYEAVSLIRADLTDAPIEVMPGKCVCEIKHSGFDKATGVRELLMHAPFKGRRPVFIGDDVTDESVFAMMPEIGGLAFSVGRRAKGVHGHFDDPADVRAWLAHLLDDERGAMESWSNLAPSVSSLRSTSSERNIRSE